MGAQQRGCPWSLGGGVKTVKMNKDSLPKIPILVNKKAAPGNTMLLALEDPIIAQAMGCGEGGSGCCCATLQEAEGREEEHLRLPGPWASPPAPLAQAILNRARALDDAICASGTIDFVSGEALGQDDARLWCM